MKFLLISALLVTYTMASAVSPDELASVKLAEKLGSKDDLGTQKVDEQWKKAEAEFAAKVKSLENGVTKTLQDQVKGMVKAWTDVKASRQSKNLRNKEIDELAVSFFAKIYVKVKQERDAARTLVKKRDGELKVSKAETAKAKADGVQAVKEEAARGAAEAQRLNKEKADAIAVGNANVLTANRKCNQELGKKDDEMKKAANECENVVQRHIDEQGRIKTAWTQKVGEAENRCKGQLADKDKDIQGVRSQLTAERQKVAQGQKDFSAMVAQKAKERTDAVEQEKANGAKELAACNQKRTDAQTECNNNIKKTSQDAGVALSKCFKAKTDASKECARKRQVAAKEADAKFSAMQKKLLADKKKEMDNQAKGFRANVKRIQDNANKRVKRTNANLAKTRTESSKQVNNALKKKRKAESAYDTEKRKADVAQEKLERVQKSYKSIEEANKKLQAFNRKQTEGVTEVALGQGESDNTLTYVLAVTTILFALTTLKLYHSKQQMSVDTPLLKEEY